MEDNVFPKYLSWSKLDFLLNAAESMLISTLYKWNFRACVEYVQCYLSQVQDLATNVIQGNSDSFTKIKGFV